jgi:hypothetical protein
MKNFIIHSISFFIPINGTPSWQSLSVQLALPS